MSDLCQLIYASRSKSDPYGHAVGASSEVAGIVSQAQRNNHALAIGGVLCFGDGHFFQCLEGERATVEALYDRIEKDPRHDNVALLRKELVLHRQYRRWSMKFLGVDQSIRSFLAEAELNRFDPRKLDDSSIDRLLELLREGTEDRTFKPISRRPREANRMAASGGISPAMLGVGALAAALTVVALIVTFIL